MRPNAAPAGPSPAIPLHPDSDVVKVVMTDPNPSPAEITAAPALSSTSGSTASGAISSGPHARIRRHHARVVVMRCVAGNLQLLQGLSHRCLTARPVAMCLGMRGRCITRPGLVQMRYQRVNFTDDALSVLREFVHALYRIGQCLRIYAEGVSHGRHRPSSGTMLAH